MKEGKGRDRPRCSCKIGMIILLMVSLCFFSGCDYDKWKQSLKSGLSGGGVTYPVEKSSLFPDGKIGVAIAAGLANSYIDKQVENFSSKLSNSPNSAAMKQFLNEKATSVKNWIGPQPSVSVSSGSGFSLEQPVFSVNRFQEYSGLYGGAGLQWTTSGGPGAYTNVGYTIPGSKVGIGVSSNWNFSGGQTTTGEVKYTTKVGKTPLQVTGQFYEGGGVGAKITVPTQL